MSESMVDPRASLIDFRPVFELVSSLAIAVLVLFAAIVTMVSCSPGDDAPTSREFTAEEEPERVGDRGTGLPPETGSGSVATRSISGGIRLTGKGPDLLPVDLNLDCLRLNGGVAPPDQRLVLGDLGGIANVVVFLDEPATSLREWRTAADDARSSRARVVEVEHRACLFSKRVVCLRVGDELFIRNQDPLPHTNHALGGVVFEYLARPQSGTYGDDEVLKVVAQGLFAPIVCDFHAWERCFVCAFDHDGYGITDRDGKFHFEVALPDGVYRLLAQHEVLGQLCGTVGLRAGQSRVEVDLEF